MLTSAERSRWGNDVELASWKNAGLHKATIIKWKIFTLDEVFIMGTEAAYLIRI